MASAKRSGTDLSPKKSDGDTDEPSDSIVGPGEPVPTSGSNDFDGPAAKTVKSGGAADTSSAYSTIKKAQGGMDSDF